MLGLPHRIAQLQTWIDHADPRKFNIQGSFEKIVKRELNVARDDYSQYAQKNLKDDICKISHEQQKKIIRLFS